MIRKGRNQAGAFRASWHLVLIVAALGACDRPAGTLAGANGTESKPVPAPEPAPFAKLIFPDALRSDDAQVNAFVERAMQVATGQDYEAFRLLWATADEPFAREQFERAWQSIVEMRIDLLRKMRDRPGSELFHAIAARAVLSAEELPEGMDNVRRIVLTIEREDGAWRLSYPHEGVKDMVNTLLEQKATDAATEDEPVVPSP